MKNPKMFTIDRRAFLTTCAAFVSLDAARGEPASLDPWSPGELLQPAALAQSLSSRETPPRILCVTFPILYRQKHIPHAEIAGPGNKPEGLARLHAAVKNVPKDEAIVIYCGCCPFDQCPNIRPSYRALKDDGFKRVQVLDLPANFHTDWVAKGYPVEKS